MTNTISELWYGNLNPVRQVGKNDSEIKNLEELISKNTKKIEALLNEKEKDFLGKYVDCINEYIALVCEQAFCNGYCLGTKITTEALVGADKIA